MGGCSGVRVATGGAPVFRGCEDAWCVRIVVVLVLSEAVLVLEKRIEDEDEDDDEA
jgi:hypothetical protein